MTPTICKHVFENGMVHDTSRGGIYALAQIGAACKISGKAAEVEMSCFAFVDYKLLLLRSASMHAYGDTFVSILRSICVHGRLRLLLQAGAASFVCTGG